MNLLDYKDLYTYRHGGYPPGEGFHPLPLFKDLPSDASTLWHDRYETAERLWRQHPSLKHPFYDGDEVQWFTWDNEPDTLVIRWPISKTNDEGPPPHSDPDSDYACLYVQFEPTSSRLFNAFTEAEQLGDDLWNIDHEGFRQEEVLYAAREAASLLASSSGEREGHLSNPTPSRRRL